MQTIVNIDSKSGTAVLEVEGIDPANYDDVVIKVLACAVRIDATQAVEVRYDSAINPECETEREE